MFDITGKISELFKNSNGVEINITNRLCESMINKPIIDSKGNAMGSIVDYDLDQDRWYGVIYKNEAAELRVNNKLYEFAGIVIK